MFDYYAFAESMKDQSKALIPSEFSQREKEYISTTMSDFVKLAGESLNNDKKNNFSDEQKIFITQVIAEWIFHKSIDLIKAEIPDACWDAILQKIAFTVFEICKQGLLKDLTQEQLLAAVECHIGKVYNECIEDLLNKNIITEDIKNLALTQSNIDSTYNNKKKKRKITDILKTILFLLLIFGIKFLIKYNIISLEYIGILCILILIIFSTVKLISYINKKSNLRNEEIELEKVRQEIQDLVNPDKMYDRLGVDVISLQVGSNLLCIADPDQDGMLCPKLVALRQKLTDNLGYIIPNVRILDSTKLKENEYSISIRGNVVDTGFVYPNKYMIDADKWDNIGKELPDNVIKAENPVYKVNAYWVHEDFVGKEKDITAVAPDDVIIQHLKEVLIQQVDYILFETEIKKYIDTVKNDNSILIESLLKKLSYEDIRQVCVNLIRERVSIKDITLLLSRLNYYSQYHKEPDILSEQIRKDFSRQISLKYCNEAKKIFAIKLSSELTNKLLRYVVPQKEYNRTKLLLDKQYEQDFIEKILNKLMNLRKKTNTRPVIVCDEKLRLALYRLLEKHMPTVVVLANSEIEPDIKMGS